MLKRQKQVTVRFTEEEYHQLKNKCDAAGMKMEPFLRALVSGCTIRKRPPDSYKALAAQVAAVGNNLNAYIGAGATLVRSFSDTFTV